MWDTRSQIGVSHKNPLVAANELLDFQAMKHLIREVHQLWKKSSDYALGCPVSPGEEPTELEAHPQPTPVGAHPLQKAPEQLAPDIF